MSLIIVIKADAYIIPPPTVIVPREPSCYYDYNVTNSVTGAYIKTLCYMESPRKSQAQASDYCSLKGMKLYTIQSADELEKLFYFASDYIDVLNWILINGQFNNGVWSTSNPTATLVSAAQPSANFYSPDGACLFVTGANTTRGGYCTESDFLCEYIVGGGS